MASHTYFVDDIVSKRVLRRGGNRNGLLFCIRWSNGQTTHEPLECLIDSRTHLEDIFPVLQELRSTAQKYPNARRKCVTCSSAVKHGNLFCESKYCKELCSFVNRVLD